MKCPKCQNEITSNAKFCTKCGCNLAEAMAKQAAKPVSQTQKPVCVKCGAPLMPGAGFCTKCGTPVAASAPKAASTQVASAPKAAPTPAASAPKAAPALAASAPKAAPTPAPSVSNADSVPKTAPSAAAPVTPPPAPQVPPKASQDDDAKTLFLFGNDAGAGNQYGNMAGAPNQMNYQQNIPQMGTVVSQGNANVNQANKKKKAKQPKKKSNVGLIIAAVILSLLLIASGVVCFLVWNGTLSLPFIDGDTEQVNDENEDGESESSSSDEKTVDVDADELLAEEDALIETGKSQITVDADIVNGMNSLTTAIDQAVTKAEEAGDAGIAADRVTDAYTSYVTAVLRHKDMLNGSTLSGGIYGQVMMELEDAIALGDSLTGKGYTVDTSSLTTARDEFDKEYTDKIITTFDEFASRPTWSRTESWNLMSETADNMFDPSDLDNPIRLRYAYALSWWTQKQIETEIANGTITAKGAAIKIANLMDVMDYNPMMMNYYITYMNESGEDCTEVENAYDDIVEHIAQTQGFTIGKDVDLEHFWYFNDFNAHPVDDANGVTQENRQWIRDRMSSVTFLKQ